MGDPHFTIGVGSCVVEKAAGDSDWYQRLHGPGQREALCVIGAVNCLCLSETAFWYFTLEVTFLVADPCLLPDLPCLKNCLDLGALEDVLGSEVCSPALPFPPTGGAGQPVPEPHLWSLRGLQWHADQLRIPL